MAASVDTKPDPNAPGAAQAPIDPTVIPDGPPEEEFWDRYNKRLEFPLSTVTAIFLHVLVAAFLVVIFTYFMKKDDRGHWAKVDRRGERTPPPIPPSVRIIV